MAYGMTYGELKRAVGRHLGFSRDPDDWGANELLDVEDAIKAGLGQFWRPPRVPGEIAAHQWSFLRPWLYLQLTVNEWDYDLPSDFGYLEGHIYFHQNDDLSSAIQVINEAHMMQMRQRDLEDYASTEPRFACISPKKYDGISDGSYTLQVYPRPDEAYTLAMKYQARQPDLNADTDIPLGGQAHAQTIRASCIAASDEMYNDTAGGETWALYIEQLRASMDYDRRAMSPMNMGYNGDGSDRGGGSYRDECRRSVGGVVQYSKFPISGNVIVTEDGEMVVTEE